MYCVISELKEFARQTIIGFFPFENALVTSFFQIFVTANFIDTKFKSKTQNNFSVTASGVDTAVASVHTRTIQNVPSLASEKFLKIDVPNEFRIDASPFVDRPYFISSFDWLNTDTQFSIIGPVNVRQLPGDVLRSNPSLLNAMKIGSYYRSDLTLQISVAGTISHAGTLLVGILPPLSSVLPTTTQRYLINTILSGPHAFLAANEATSISIEVPWYCNSDLATLDMESSSATYIPSGDISVTNGNYATLVFLVLNPLAPSTGASTSVTVTIDAAFKHLDIVVPTPRYITYLQSGLLDTLSGAATSVLDAGASFVKTTAGDFIDSVRSSIKHYTGLHNPNNASIDKRVIITNRNFLNTIDETQFFETLDPNPSILRTVDRPLFGTDVDEMAISHIISKKQYLGQFRIKDSTTVGTLAWARPISPYQGGLESDSFVLANNIELLHHLTRAWRGSIKISIQSVMNNKQQLKLRLLQLYNPSVKILSGYPTYNSILNAPSHLMEFTAGNQVQEVVLPYLCRNHICPNMRETSSESLFHGEYYIYLASKLANADGSPTDVYFNVYISLEPDFTFYGYSTELNVVSSPVSVPPSVATKFPEIMSLYSSFDQSNVSKRDDLVKTINGTIVEEGKVNEAKRDKSLLEMNIRQVVIDQAAKAVRDKALGLVAKLQSLEVMNEPQEQDPLISVLRDASSEAYDRLMPLHDLRPLLRRITPYEKNGTSIDVNGTSFAYTSVSTLFTQLAFVGAGQNFTPAQTLNSMFYGRTGGVKVSMTVVPSWKEHIDGDPSPLDSMNVSVSYVPPNFYLDANTGTFHSSLISTDGMAKFTNATGQFFPVPFTLARSGNTDTYEFKIPNTNFYKFIGAPTQILPALTGSNSLSTSGMGYLLVQFSNLNKGKVLYVDYVLSFAYTDETRAGFHTVAPVVRVPTAADSPDTILTPYFGTPTSASELPSSKRNKYLYFNLN